MTRALLIVDIQLDYFPGGAFPLVEPEAAAAAAGDVLEEFRASGEPVVHVFHVSTGDGATFFRPGTAGVAFHHKQNGEWVDVDSLSAELEEDLDCRGLTGPGVARVGKRAAGRLLDGVEHSGLPEARP